MTTITKIVRFDEESEQALLTLANEIGELRLEFHRVCEEFLGMASQLINEVKETLVLEVQDFEQEWSLDGE